MRILVADDHAIVRKGLIDLLGDVPERPTVGEAVNGQDVLDQLRSEPWDVLVLDLSMPGLSGIDVLKEARRIRPELRVLILSMHPEDQFGVRVLKAGAAGYLAKDAAPEELTEAVRKVMAGGKYISSAMAERLAAELARDPEVPPHETLSDREFQVMRMIAIGKSIKDIANDLALSVKTVSTYRARILEKLDLRSNAEVIRYALQHQLIE